MKKPDFVGRRSLARIRYRSRTDRKQLVGLLPLDPTELLPEGAQLTVPDAGRLARPRHVELLQRGARPHVRAGACCALDARCVGGVVQVPLLDGRTVHATVTEPVFYDPSNERRDA